MRLLFALTYYRPHISGLTIYAQRLAEALAARGATVTILTSRYDPALPGRERLGGVEVIRAPVLKRVGKGVVMPTFPALAWELLGRHDALGIHVPQAEAALLAGLSRLRGRPCVLTYHCDLRLPPGMLNRAADGAVAVTHRLAARLADRVVAYTADYAAHSAVLRGVSGRLVVIPPPVDVPVADAEDVRQFQRRHGVEGADGIGFAARLASEKGVEYLLQAMPTIVREWPGARVLFAGPYRDIAGEAAYYRRLRPALERFSAQWRMLGELSPAEMAAFYRACRVTVLPSINSTESFGLVQVESMLCGTPVVASDLAGVRVPIQTTGMGELVPPRDAAALAQAVLRVLRDPERYQRSRGEIAAHFSTDRTCEDYLRLFRTLIAPPPGARRPTRAAPGVGDKLAGHLREVPAFRSLLRTAEATLMARHAPLDEPALDLGCGDGHFAAHAFRHRPALGIDPSLPALAAAAARGSHGWLAAASATAIPLRDGSLATVFANSVLEHIPEVDAALGEVARILRPGGRLLATVPSHRFADLLLGSTVLRRLGLGALARGYGVWFNRHSRHFHAEAAEWWVSALARHGLAVDGWHYYFPARAHRVFDALHYAGLPALLSRRLTGRWVYWRNPLTLALGRRWLAPLCDPRPVADGAYLFFVARRSG